MANGDSGNSVAVIVVNYNGIRFLADCLDSVRGQTLRPSSVTIFDNGSTDGSAELVERDYPEVKLIRSSKNVGFATGNNRAIAPVLERGEAEYVFTLNNDVVLEPDCLERLVDTMVRGPRTLWSCQPKMYLSSKGSGEKILNNAGIQVWLDGSAFNRGINQVDRGQYDQRTEIFGTCAGASLYRAAALREIGLFDGDFFAYLEDVDLAWRGRRAGYTSALCPRAVCHHHHGGTGGDPAAKIVRLERNRTWLLVKEYPLILVAASPLFTAYRFARISLSASRGAGKGSRIESYRGGMPASRLLAALARGLLAGARGIPASVRKRRAFANENILGESEALRLVMEYSVPLCDALDR